MENSHWLIIATCQRRIGPLGLYDLPNHLPIGHATSPTWLV
jgi:hypothetical protein